jgi:hypothetical protein
MKTCNKCGKKGLFWNREYFEKNGKWKLNDHRNKDNEWCIRNNTIIKEIIKITKKDYIHCEFCGDSDFGWLRKENYKEHIKIHHPNGEIRNNSYYQV